jgi:phospholipase C
MVGKEARMALEDIEHIVVLVMENRSFDHYLGYLRLEGYRDALGAEVDGLDPAMKNPDRSTGKDHAVRRLEAPRFNPSPKHEFTNVAGQLAYNERGDAQSLGFVNDYGAVKGVTDPGAVMGYYDKTTLTTYDALARGFVVCDRWFSSVPGPTLPNRCFLLAGHSQGATTNPAMVEMFALHRIITIFDHLSEKEVKWAYYYHDVPILRLFKQFTFTVGPIQHISRFHDAVQRNALPAVSFIDPNFTLQGAVHLPDGGNDDHPPSDIRNGQNLVARVYNTLRSNPEVWKRTLLIVTYDEHGGFFDHVAPPLHPDRAPLGKPNFHHFGVRVPAFLVSPWVPRGVVHKGELEHTSIIKTILDRFWEPSRAPSMGERVNGAPSLRSLLVEPRPREDAPAELSPISVPPPMVPTEPHEPSDIEQFLVRLRDTAQNAGISFNPF